MTIELDHVIVPALEQRAAARLRGELLGVPWARRGSGPIEHDCFRVGDPDFDAIPGRIRAAGIARGSSFRDAANGQVANECGGRLVDRRQPGDHVRAILTASDARRPA